MSGLHYRIAVASLALCSWACKEEASTGLSEVTAPSSLEAPDQETTAGGIDRRLLVGAMAHSGDANPSYAWSFGEATFLLERRQAAALPPAIVESVMGVNRESPWVLGRWSLGDGGTTLELTECQCFGSIGIRGSGVLDIDRDGDGGVVIDGAIYQIEPGAAQDTSRVAAPRLVAFQEGTSKKWGYRNSFSGEVELPAIYEIVWDFSSDGIGIVWDEVPYVIGTDGEQIVQPVWIDDAPDPFRSGLARYVDEEGKIGFYDPRGNIRVPARWGYAESFEGGYALVNATGSVDERVDSDGHFFGHELRAGDRWGVIDERGAVVLAPRYPNLQRGEAGMVRIAEGEPWFHVGGEFALRRE